MGDFVLRPDEIEVLVEICRILDLCEELHKDGELVELRLQRQLLSRLLIQLGLPDVDGSVMPSPVSIRARRAAGSRWAGHIKKGDD